MENEKQHLIKGSLTNDIFIMEQSPCPPGKISGVLQTSPQCRWQMGSLHGKEVFVFKILVSIIPSMGNIPRSVSPIDVKVLVSPMEQRIDPVDCRYFGSGDLPDDHSKKIVSCL